MNINNNNISTLGPLKQQQPQQQIKSDKKKTSSRLRFLSLSSKHKQQKKHPQQPPPPQHHQQPTTSAPNPTTNNTLSSIRLSNEATMSSSYTTSFAASTSRFFSSRSKIKRSSISISANAAPTPYTAPPTTSLTTTTTTTTSTTSKATTTLTTPPIPKATTTLTMPAKPLVRNSASTTVANTSGQKKNTTSTQADPTSNESVISSPIRPVGIEIKEIDGTQYIECQLCVLVVSYADTPDLKTCSHRTCLDCMQRYLKTEINHSRLNLTCPICSEPLLQNVIKEILNDDKFYSKYESFMLRKVLAAEPDARWCPAPDCSYAVLANGCASCPRLVCGREGCNTAFCYHCKQEWHPNQTCSAASIQRNKHAILTLNALNISDLIEEPAQSNGRSQGSNQRKSSKSSQNNAIFRPEDIKECPVCSSRIIKMNDGSCNHMTCSICETQFCWLCMKEISDFHYFSPSGCTFWGKKPWSRKKKLLWRLGMLVGAPICIVFMAGIAVPAIVIGIPVWAARKLHTRLEKKQFSRYRKNAIITGGVLLSFVISPIISAMALAAGVPMLLIYVYVVVPLGLCRASGGCLSASASVENLNNDSGLHMGRDANNQPTDVVSISTAASHKLGNPSIGEISLYMSNISLETNSIGHANNAERYDRESSSNAGLAGSMLSQNVEDENSMRALAGSIISKESNGYTLVPAEIHIQSPSTSTASTSDADSGKDSSDSEQQLLNEAETRLTMITT